WDSWSSTADRRPRKPDSSVCKLQFSICNLLCIPWRPHRKKSISPPMTLTAPDIDFQRAFARGRKSYDTPVGDWWEGRSSDPAHQRAYARIADFLAGRFGSRQPRLIVDYACGNGAFLPHLAARFPRTRIVALDGS